MRKIIVAAFVSLDGVMQAPGGPDEDPTGGFKYGGWTVPYWHDAIGEVLGETFSKPFDLLLGRKTYEILAAHWPFDTEDPGRRTPQRREEVRGHQHTDRRHVAEHHHPRRRHRRPDP